RIRGFRTGRRRDRQGECQCRRDEKRRFHTCLPTIDVKHVNSEPLVEADEGRFGSTLLKVTEAVALHELLIVRCAADRGESVPRHVLWPPQLPLAAEPRWRRIGWPSEHDLRWRDGNWGLLIGPRVRLVRADGPGADWRHGGLPAPSRGNH